MFSIWKVVKYKPDRCCNIKSRTYIIPGKTLHRKKVLPFRVLLGKKLRVETKLCSDPKTKYWPKREKFSSYLLTSMLSCGFTLERLSDIGNHLSYIHVCNNLYLVSEKTWYTVLCLPVKRENCVVTSEKESLLLNVAVEWITLLFRVSKVSGSNLFPETKRIYWGLS
jgi:hypothetical protein